MKKTTLLGLSLALTGAGRARAQTLESAAADLKEAVAIYETAAARGALSRCAREIEAYHTALADQALKMRSLAAEASARESFDLHWGGEVVYSAEMTLKADLPPPSGMMDANIDRRPLSAWWQIWDAAQSKNAPRDASFRAQAGAAAESLRDALGELDRLEKASSDVYAVLARKGVRQNEVVFGEGYFSGLVDYRRADLSKMLATVERLAKGDTARMKDPAGW